MSELIYEPIDTRLEELLKELAVILKTQEEVIEYK
jgi:hypothetical protein